MAVADGLSMDREAFVIAHELAHAVNDEWGLIERDDKDLESIMDAVAQAVCALRSEQQ